MAEPSEVKPIVGPTPHSKDWYGLRIFDPTRDRKVVWGASQAANVCGQGPYGSALEEYCIAKGVTEKDFGEQQEERMRVGQLVEPAILQIYAEKQDCAISTGHPMYFHAEHAFMGATPDAMRVHSTDNPDTWVWCVDAKSTNWRMFDKTGENVDKYGQEGTDQVPRYILFQAQQLMAVLGVRRVDFAVLCDGLVRIYTVDRSDELIKQIVEAEDEMVQRLVNDDPPAPAWTHSGTSKLINDMYGVSVGKVITLEPVVQDMYKRALLMDKEKKELEKSIKELKNRVAWAMADAEIAYCGDLQLKRTVVKDSVGTMQHVLDAKSKVGKVIRKGYTRLTKSVRKDET
jgi:predicted phage-related endonuclease